MWAPRQYHHTVKTLKTILRCQSFNQIYCRPFSKTVDELRAKISDLDETAELISQQRKEAAALLSAALSEGDTVTKNNIISDLPALHKLGTTFERREVPAFLEKRNAIFQELLERSKIDKAEALSCLKAEDLVKLDNRKANGKINESVDEITVIGPDGVNVTLANQPTVDVSPVDLAKICNLEVTEGKKGVVVARITLRSIEGSSHLGTSAELAAVLGCEDISKGSINAKSSTNMNRNKGTAETAEATTILWDIHRPIPFNSSDSGFITSIELLDRNDVDAQRVLRHSSAHILGACFENLFGAQLTIGPPTDDGFFYDAYMGEDALKPEDLVSINKLARKRFINKRLSFERVSLSKEDAVRLFSDNPFKLDILKTKVPDGALTSAYRVGNMVDLCLGPHIPDTSHIGSFEAISSSRSYYKGDAAHGDPLQRVYGVAFSEKGDLKNWKRWRKEADLRNHRQIGERQKLFFFNDHSPGSAFFTPEGTILYTQLMNFVRRECRRDGIQEIITPNIFRLDLWEKSGHAQHYRDDMFIFNTQDEETFGLKPMNCPAHCVMYAQQTRSYRDLPIRYLDFGALHRNELSGALGGLTRVRRFQQDDVHIFCRRDQVKEEVQSTMSFLDRVYATLGMEFSACLSTRPAKALGDEDVWEEAECMMAEALNEYCGVGGWELNAGDGAFYGPKIDIHVRDALGRSHQCATVQLDFQLPQRFNLSYRAPQAKNLNPNEESNDREQPVIIHRAMLGSVERMMAILSEHYNGHWPLWLSPRQVAVIPVSSAFDEYALEVSSELQDAGLQNITDIVYVLLCKTIADVSSKTLSKKVREAQVLSFNYQFVVGATEAEGKSVSVRDRSGEQHGTISVREALALLQNEIKEYR